MNPWYGPQVKLLNAFLRAYWEKIIMITFTNFGKLQAAKRQSLKMYLQACGFVLSQAVGLCSQAKVTFCLPSLFEEEDRN